MSGNLLPSYDEIIDDGRQDDTTSMLGVNNHNVQKDIKLTGSLTPPNESINPVPLSAQTEAMDVDAASNPREGPKHDLDTVLPLTGMDETASCIFKWRVPDWKSATTREQLGSKQNSPEWECGGFKWSILYFPWGNRGSGDHISYFLESKDAHQQPEGSKWSCCVLFAMGVVNPRDNSVNIIQHAQHRYTREATDWGFGQGVSAAKLKGDPRSPALSDRELGFELVVWMRIIHDETGYLWHDFRHWDSKAETGYVGLKNQGATCYMNSLLQSLYFTTYFRKAAYAIPTDNDEPTKSVPLALQRVFFNLQNSDDAVGTTELTKSFGWDTLDSFMQHDVQEFNRVLQDNLESKMKGTKAEGAISKLFVGKMKSYIRCIDVPYESSRTEDFYDIQLNVKGCTDLRASFADYIAVETLDGDNKYMAEGYGLQDAKKGVIFTEFPPILHLQLKRFEYDFMRDAMVKINDRHEYPLEIELDEFLESNTPEQGPKPAVKQKYHLHGVLVHSGDLHGGHYQAFLRPKLEDRWFKFDDDKVTPASKSEVFEDNFGGATGRLGKRYTNAYMLVYVRDADRPTVLAEVTDEDIPEHLKRRFAEEKAYYDQKKQEQEEAHLYVPVRILTDEAISLHRGFDLTNFNDLSLPVHSTKVRKDAKWSEFLQHVKKLLGLDNDRFRVWGLTQRQNKTLRPDPAFDIAGDTVMALVRDKYSGRSYSNDLRVYVETRPCSLNNIKQSPTSKLITLFFKYYDPSTSTMNYAGNVSVDPKHQKVCDAFEFVCHRVGLPVDTPLVAYEEVKPEMIDAIPNMKLTFEGVELGDGDILVFQKDWKRERKLVMEKMQAEGKSEEEIQAYKQRFQQEVDRWKYPDVPKYFEAWRNKVLITFKMKGSDRDNGITLQLSRKMHYDDIATRLAHALGHPNLAGKIKLFSFATSQSGLNQPLPLSKNAQPIRHSPTWTLEMAFAPGTYPQYPNEELTGTIWYEVLELDLKEMERKRGIRTWWVGKGGRCKWIGEVWVDRTAKVPEFIERVEAKIQHEELKVDDDVGPTPMSPQTSDKELDASDSWVKIQHRDVDMSDAATSPLPVSPIHRDMAVFTLTPHSRLDRVLLETDSVAIIPATQEIFVSHYFPYPVTPQSQPFAMLQVISFTRDPTRGHSIPFFLPLYPNDTYESFTTRIRQICTLSEREFTRVGVWVLPLDLTSTGGPLRAGYKSESLSTSRESLKAAGESQREDDHDIQPIREVGSGRKLVPEDNLWQLFIPTDNLAPNAEVHSKFCVGLERADRSGRGAGQGTGASIKILG
ncbi:hypothetical protein BC832DRAFT_621755 [Gaertneriomyces semiglobifer]|nr:hypothetical protein BC832DRAFT_621755 [Gaertneriomyces semiglobifer]